MQREERGCKINADKVKVGLGLMSGKTDTDYAMDRTFILEWVRPLNANSLDQCILVD